MYLHTKIYLICCTKKNLEIFVTKMVFRHICVVS